MRIVFTGHRDAQARLIELQKLHREYRGAVWIHGGAKGFDTQVRRFAEEHKIMTEVHRPDYGRYYYKQAPLVRNKTMVDSADLVVACYNDTKRGGTYFTICYAQETGVPVRIIRPKG